MSGDTDGFPSEVYIPKNGPVRVYVEPRDHETFYTDILIQPGTFVKLVAPLDGIWTDWTCLDHYEPFDLWVKTDDFERLTFDKTLSQDDALCKYMTGYAKSRLSECKNLFYLNADFMSHVERYEA